jgi:hypothetical protein
MITTGVLLAVCGATALVFRRAILRLMQRNLARSKHSDAVSQVHPTIRMIVIAASAWIVLGAGLIVLARVANAA